MFLAVLVLALSWTFSRASRPLCLLNNSPASRLIRPLGSVVSVSSIVPMFIARILLLRLGQAFVGTAYMSQSS